MIVLQLPASARSSSYQPCHSPSPGGEGRDEGELNHSSGYQPALIKMGCCRQVHCPRLYPRASLCEKSMSIRTMERVPSRKVSMRFTEILTYYNLLKTPSRGGMHSTVSDGGLGNQYWRRSYSVYSVQNSGFSLLPPFPSVKFFAPLREKICVSSVPKTPRLCVSALKLMLPAFTHKLPMQPRINAIFLQ